MKSVITRKEEKQYYSRSYLLLPLLMGVIFSIIILIIYNLAYLIFHGKGIHWDTDIVLKGFVLGFFDGLLALYLDLRLTKKNNIYYNNYIKKGNTDLFLPVILEQGLFKETQGVLIITKDSVEFRIHQFFRKKTLFEIPYKDVNFEFTREENHWLISILTMTKVNNILYITANDKKYRFVIPCNTDLAHRLQTNRMLVQKG